nr:MBL fold metallo-hydrolase [Haloplanus aerogenes]
MAALDTHAHADHVSGGAALAARHNVPYYLHPADALGIDASPLEDGQTITIGTVEISVIHTPGHSEGSVSYSQRIKFDLDVADDFHTS